MRRILQRYLITDIYFIVYLLAVTMLLTTFRRAVPGWYINAGMYLATAGILIVTLPYWENDPDGNRFFYLLRTGYPMMLIVVTFKHIEQNMFMVFPEYIDPWLEQIDRWMFGGVLPSDRFAEIIPWRWFSELMSLFYMSYYAQVFGLIMLSFFKRRHYRRIIANITFAFYLCYLIYTVVPALGPSYAYGKLHNDLFDGYLIAPFLQNVVFMGDSNGAAFPSSHCLISVLCTTMAIRFFPKLRNWYLFFSFGLILSTVYIKQHYVIDSLLGVLLAPVFYILGEKLFRSWNRGVERRTI